MSQTEYNSRELALRNAYVAGTISFEALDAGVAALRCLAGLTTIAEFGSFLRLVTPAR